MADGPDGNSRGRTETRLEPLQIPRKSNRDRWGIPYSLNKAADKTRLPVFITGLMTPEQLEAYALHFRMEEVTQRLRMGDVVPPEKDRSPSPAPTYDNKGVRTNTREIRYRQKLEEERHILVDRAIKIIPNFVPPSDYQRPGKTQEKIYIPALDYPEINFVGHLLGPRGKTLKQMEKESGAKIAIRGKGSVKEGKGRTDLPGSDNFDDDLHCVITGDNPHSVQKAISLVNKIIETLASTPEASNDLKKGQLRELATLNGTLRPEEISECPNCGETGHRRYECPHRKNLTATIVCPICGGHGHFAKDCKERKSGARTAADQEYEQLMMELRGGTRNNGNMQPDGQRSSARESSPSRKPWQERRRDDYRDRGRDNYYDSRNRDRDYRRDNRDSYSGRGRRDDYRDSRSYREGYSQPSYNDRSYDGQNPNLGMPNLGMMNQGMPNFFPPPFVPPQMAQSGGRPPSVVPSVQQSAPPPIAPPKQSAQPAAPPGLAPPGLAPPGVPGMMGMAGIQGLVPGPPGVSNNNSVPPPPPPPA